MKHIPIKDLLARHPTVRVWFHLPRKAQFEPTLADTGVGLVVGLSLK